MGKLALVGLGTALGTALGSLGVLAGQRSGILPPPTTPGDPWESPSTTTEQAPQEGPLRCLSVAEVAELLGVTHTQVETDSDLPEPDVTVGGTRGWLEPTIECWLGDRLARAGGRAES
ncbi:hypothetical protein BJEO58_00339 [Brevibacterium jeotgali]|uniref:Uncharacterized protein n=2 Tax=Brevibacterium jeotgali TaxID=1262550 RepID=A0A2H1L1G4_9MICO|nr:hypothetical protein FB108_0543 [Brevibacterium jeotgali]SMY10764.1 hypothetical protein BJEO58_00339 [Brevibacterium jeotgali]